MRKNNRFWPRLLIFGMIAWLIPSLACNFPGKTLPMNGPEEKELRQTIAAQLNPTAAAPTAKATATPAPAATLHFPSGSLPTPGMPPIEPSQSANLKPENANYIIQSGDTLTAIARRFQVEPEQIQSAEPMPETGFLPPGQSLSIPVNPNQLPSWEAILPDSEVINSPSALDFDLGQYIATSGGYLSGYTEKVYDKHLSGVEIIERVSQESSVNPRFLLAFLEYRSGWVLGQPASGSDLDHPIGFYVPNQLGLYNEMVMAATHLNIGYYGWRSGQLTNLKFSDGQTTSINPWLNPGTVAVQNLFAKFYTKQTWSQALYGAQKFTDLYIQSFGDPWQRAAQVEPFFLPGLTQPALELPFAAGERWSLTGGPHAAWNPGSPRGALDFAPVTGEPACSVSRAWVTASSKGLVIRSANSVVAIDLDEDGREETGWVIVYLHIAETDRIQAGERVQVNDRLGHPSCERGQSTGTHVHIARKFNGEWLEADGSIPFILSGWQVKAGEKNYQGSLQKGTLEVSASPVGPSTSIIVR